jgi:hypothetical protein
VIGRNLVGLARNLPVFGQVALEVDASANDAPRVATKVRLAFVTPMIAELAG